MQDNGGPSWGPEQGADIAYDCPECDYARTTVTTSRHGFKLHLVHEHDYSLEAFEALVDASSQTGPRQSNA